jgi:hypothetical protein
MLDQAMSTKDCRPVVGPAGHSDHAVKMREALRKVMEAKGLKPHPWAARAGVSSGSIYAFLKGETDFLSMPILHKLAFSAGVSISALTGEEAAPLTALVPISHALRIDRIVPLLRPPKYMAPAPLGERQDDLRVAEIQQGGFGLLQEGTYLYWHEPEFAEPLAEAPRGLSVVALEVDDQEQLYLGTLRGPAGGPWVLVTPSGAIVDNAKAVSAWPIRHIIPA